ncbi:hypothetical protein DL1_11340 [Thioclava dalianensis]|uniref:Uncharacterized protein n=1 Tax=Thioclava dalianensis TaxID=1185766 RepID=A0A074T9R0_9RHOB|nr:hypothetical protein [Thioclava dalianensis]KEP68541.1 hypothetical protein DL1_11340 [Thioclava dalianensis]SFN84465.1 hypothetical protein SAMN05216224_11729 [Thioclava dalianensis]
MTYENVSQTLSARQMHTEALIIEALLEASMAILSGLDPADMVGLLEQAQTRASRLGNALDAIERQEEGAA